MMNDTKGNLNAAFLITEGAPLSSTLMQRAICIAFLGGKEHKLTVKLWASPKMSISYVTYHHHNNILNVHFLPLGAPGRAKLEGKASPTLPQVLHHNMHSSYS
jgi:hypothetical protein